MSPAHGAFADQLPLELGQRCEDAEHEAAGRGRGVDLRALAGEHPQAHAAGRQVLHGVDEMGEVAAQAVELPDDEHVALPQGAQAASSWRPMKSTTAGGTNSPGASSYTPRMLRTLDIEASPVAKPLLEAVDVLRSDATARPTVFLRPNSKWSRLLRSQSDHRLWETAVLFHLRDAFRAGDVWLARSRALRRYQKGAAVGSRRR